MDFAAARINMVEGQVRTGDVTDLRLLAVMRELPRERFAPPDQAGLAYADLDLPLAVARPPPGGPSASAPRAMLRGRTLAKLIQAAEIEPADRVLDVGSGTGYGAAVLAGLAAEVVALEEDSGLAAFAAGALGQCGIRNAALVTRPLASGWPAAAPYAVIVLEGATEIVPRSLFGQLASGGRLVCIEGRGPSARAMVYRAADGGVSGRPVFDAAAPLLPGFAAAREFVF